MKEAILYEPIEKDGVLCTACKLKCRISEGRSGVCGVRLNQGGKLYLLVYGKASAVHIDPVEKKPLFHFLPGSDIFSIGTIGCNFGCTFCQNWDLSQVSRSLRDQLRKERKESELRLEVGKYGYDLPPERIVEICEEKGIPAIAYTYNEPVIFFEYLYDCARIAANRGIKNVFVSNGYESDEALSMIRPYLHGMNIDLKAFSDRFYTKICKARLQPVLDTIREAYELGIWIEITTLIIPEENDSEEELEQIARFIANIDPGIPWHISAFHPDFQMTDKIRTPGSTLIKAYEIGEKVGLKYIYIGNVIDKVHSGTYCPQCKARLIERTGFRSTVSKNMNKGQCLNCGYNLKGVWE